MEAAKSSMETGILFIPVGTGAASPTAPLSAWCLPPMDFFLGGTLKAVKAEC